MNCKDCEDFEGYGEEGEVICENAGDCPYEEEGQSAEKAGQMTVTINLGDMQDRIENAFRNSISDKVNATIARIIQEEFSELIRKMTKEAIDSLLHVKVAEFMEQPIQIGGGWREEARVVSRSQYLSETIEDKLKSNFDKDKLSDTITSEVRGQIKKFSSDLKNDVNREVKNMFDAATRATLTDSIVSMLMDNQTYQTLSSSMQHLIGGAKE